MSVILDVDGVLADFVLGFSTLMHGVAPSIPIRDTRTQTGWGFGDAEVEGHVWQGIRKSDLWWTTLKPLVQPQELKLLSSTEGRDVYFVTSRVGRVVQAQTRRWLNKHGLASHPNVVVVESKKLKPLVAVAVGATWLIDDNAEVCLAYKKALPEAEVFLATRKYNAESHEECVKQGVRLVDSVVEFTAALRAVGLPH